jgi:hypothetical protein
MNRNDLNVQAAKRNLLLSSEVAGLFVVEGRVAIANGQALDRRQEVIVAGLDAVRIWLASHRLPGIEAFATIIWLRSLRVLGQWDE